MISQIIYWIGAAVCIAGGAAIAAYSLLACALLSNRVQNHLLKSYGGWKVFREFRDWYHENKRGAQIIAGAETPKEGA